MEQFNTIEKGMAVLKDMMKKHEELDKIQRIKERAIKSDITANDLADALTEMCAYLFRIGVLCSEKTNMANEAYIYRKLKYMFSYNSLGDGIKIKDKEGLAMQSITEQYEAELVNRFVADYMKTLYDDYSRLISVLQSKLALLRSEMSKLN